MGLMLKSNSGASAALQSLVGTLSSNIGAGDDQASQPACSAGADTYTLNYRVSTTVRSRRIRMRRLNGFIVSTTPITSLPV
ncbi:MAG: hypothetical protein ACLRMJ_11355 [Alistipes finegoldii]